MRRVWIMLGVVGLLLAGVLGCRSGGEAGAVVGADPGGGGDDVVDQPADARGGDWCDDGCDGHGGQDGQEPDCVTDSIDPNDPSLEIDPQVCQLDSDCLVGTPRDCCISFCPEDAQAWSHDAWRAYQEECAVEECPMVETLACRNEGASGPAITARCVHERCVLR